MGSGRFNQVDAFGEPGAPSNLLIGGDCFDALGQLLDQDDYRGQVRLAYLDPPFNTGERFRDFNDSMDSSKWLEFIEPRLWATWSMLRADGSLWIHCDDSEQARLRVLADDLLGRDSFVATVVWQRRYSRENRMAFSRSHDYIHVYAPAGSEWKHHRNRLPRNDKQGTWRNADDDPRGPWSTVSLVAQGGHGTPDQFYAITLPSGRVVEPPLGSCWRLTNERFDELDEQGLVWYGNAGDNSPRRKVFLRDALGLVPSTWWPHLEVGHVAEATAELRKIFPEEIPFSTPKPERLMSRIISLATDPGDLVLDPFLGSATTTAVAHKAGRKWVGIERNSLTIERFCAPRMRGVVLGADEAGATEIFDWRGGGGFGVVETGPLEIELAEAS